MKIRIEKKSGERFLLLFGTENDVEGIYLSSDDFKKLKNNMDQMIEYEMTDIGDSL